MLEDNEESVVFAENVALDEDAAREIRDALATNTALRVLTLMGCGLDGAAVAAMFADLPHVLGLQRLSLSKNAIDDAGAIALSEAVKRMPCLVELLASGNKIGPDGARALASCLDTNPLLREVFLAGNPFESAGASASGVVKELDAKRARNRSWAPLAGLLAYCADRPAERSPARKLNRDVLGVVAGFLVEGPPTERAA